MKIIIEKPSVQIVVEIPDDSDAGEVSDAFKIAMVGVGFHPKTADAYVNMGWFGDAEDGEN